MTLETRRQTLLSLIEAAILAPSGDNMQPWRFHVDPLQGVIALAVDPMRDPSPMNAGQRMSRIAIGAALENLVRTAKLNHCQFELEIPAGDIAAQFRLTNLPAGEFQRDDTLAERVTNRRIYDNRPVPDDDLAALQGSTPPIDDVETRWIVERPQIETLAELVGRADAAMFGQASMRKAFIANVRFDAPANQRVTEGLSLGSLELKLTDRVALRQMARIPDWVLRMAGATKKFAAHARKLINSAAGICVVTAPDWHASTDVTVGRCMQRAWLELAKNKLAAQPMMSLMVLDNLLQNGNPTIVDSIGRSRLSDLRSALSDAIRLAKGNRVAFLLRFGTSPLPTARTGRMAVDKVLTADADISSLVLACNISSISHA